MGIPYAVSCFLPISDHISLLMGPPRRTLEQSKHSIQKIALSRPDVGLTEYKMLLTCQKTVNDIYDVLEVCTQSMTEMQDFIQPSLQIDTGLNYSRSSAISDFSVHSY